MINNYKEKSTLGRFIMHVNNEQLKGVGLRNPSASLTNTYVYNFVYNKGESQFVAIDEIVYTMPANTILPLLSNQNFSFEHPDQLIAWQFNREFYCIVNHDTEVGCAGFLFYGIHHPMFISLSTYEIEAMIRLERLFFEEWQSQDNFQGEMLRSLLKILIIKATRAAKQQCESYQQFSEEKMDIIRKFSILLECHFKKEHEVKFYAAALNKSPKTLSNIFAMLKQPAPSKLIQNRIIMEAKRYLHYTNKYAKEIAFELGFESAAHFSRFFKLYSGSNISSFRSL